MKTFLGKHVSVFTFQRTDISRESDVIQYRGYPKDLSFRLRTEIYDFFAKRRRFVCVHSFVRTYLFNGIKIFRAVSVLKNCTKVSTSPH